MTGEELIAEAERIARRCVLLRAQGSTDSFAAVWGGPGIVPAPVGNYRHWLSIDCRFLPKGLGPTAGCLSVYANEEDCRSGVATLDPVGKLAASEKAIPLFAHEARSLPPVDAVFRFGSPAVHTWLRSNDLAT
jgi:hypothetical protein